MMVSPTGETSNAAYDDTGALMDKLDFLLKFRRSSSEETLEKVIEHMEPKINKDDYSVFLAAADHRRAELACKKIFDKVPKSAWKFVK